MGFFNNYPMFPKELVYPAPRSGARTPPAQGPGSAPGILPPRPLPAGAAAVFLQSQPLTFFPLQIGIPPCAELECGGYVPRRQWGDNKLLPQGVAWGLCMAPAARPQEQQPEHGERQGRRHACGCFRLSAVPAPTKAGLQ